MQNLLRASSRPAVRTLIGFDGANNSIGFLRFFCAFLVLVSHDYGLGGYGGASEPVVALSHNEWSLGTVAVSSFFFLSGFLVTRSYLSVDDAVRFLWHRCLRIYPAYWVCLAVTGFGFGGILYFGTHGTLAGFLDPSADNSPWGFITRNYTLEVYQFDVLHLVNADPFKAGINGSIWTLATEFRCYLFVMALGLLGLLARARLVALGTFLVLFALSISPTFFPTAEASFPPLAAPFRATYAFEEMTTYFMAGCCALLFAERIPIRTWGAVLAFIVGIAAFPFPLFRIVETFALPYVLMWTMTRRFPFRISRGADYSYGIYLYAFPAAQTISFFHGNAFGLFVYDCFTAALTLCVAAASWHLVEHPALRLKNAQFPSWLRLSTPRVLSALLGRADMAVDSLRAKCFATLRGLADRRGRVRTGTSPVLRVVALFGMAVVGYLIAIVCVFPHHVAPLAPHHSDMYIAPDLAAQRVPLSTLLSGPRPIIWLVEEGAGYLGLEPSVATFLAIALLDLALAVYILERSIIQRALPAWICVLTFTLAMSAPGAYVNAGYDLGTALAMLFGFLGIIAWESRGRGLILPGALCASLFTLSVLSKEGFVPILIIYAIVSAWQSRSTSGRYVLAFPLIALAVLFVDARSTHSQFVSSNHDPSAPYFVSFAPRDIFDSLVYYFQPVFTPALIALVGASLVASFLARRGRLALLLLFSGLSLQAPYLILPNHRLGYYWWITIPIIMLLIPLALGPVAAAEERTPEQSTRVRRRFTVAVASLALLSIALYVPVDAADEQWFVTQQEINAAMLHGLRTHDDVIRSAHNVLVTGLSSPFYPWSHEAYVDRYLHFTGRWSIAYSADQHPAPMQPGVVSIAYSDIRWVDYDLILVFDVSGNLVGAYQPSQVAALAATGPRASQLEVVERMQREAPVSQATPEPVVADAGPPTSAPSMPQGISPEPPAQGIYPPDGTICCWVGSSAQFTLTHAKSPRHLLLTVYIPDSIPVSAAPSEISVHSGSGMFLGSARMHFGLQVVDIAIPAGRLRGNSSRLEITPNRFFTPKALGLNGDFRQLSFLLVRAAFE